MHTKSRVPQEHCHRCPKEVKDTVSWLDHYHFDAKLATSIKYLCLLSILQIGVSCCSISDGRLIITLGVPNASNILWQ